MGKRELRKIVPRGITEEDVRTIAGPWVGAECWEARLEAKPSTLALKVQEPPEL